MRATSSIYLFGVVLSGVVALAAEPTGPRTLKNAIAAADGEPQAAVVADDAADEKEATEPPAVRKNDPLQQRLDAALAEYNPAIEKAIDELAKEIEEEFNKATKKGDIELARKCKKAEESLNERGTPPEGDFLKHAREETSRTITRAGAKLAAKFEAVAKECLRDGDLDRAESVLSEKADLLAEMKEWRARDELLALSKSGAKALPPIRQKNGISTIFLIDLVEQGGYVGLQGLGKGSVTGEASSLIEVNGERFERGLGTHPLSNKPARVKYTIPSGYTHFEATAAINDSAGRRQNTSNVFKVLGDGRLLWQSRPLLGGGSTEKCSVELRGTRVITLEVECFGDQAWSHAVWCDPCFTKK
jgi:hypothetical protein